MQELVDKLNNFKADADRRNKAILKRTLAKGKEEAIPRTPVDTGLSKKSWVYKVISPGKGKLKNTADYSSFWNYGTSRGIVGTQTMQKAMNIATVWAMPEIAKEEIKKSWENA